LTGKITGNVVGDGENGYYETPLIMFAVLILIIILIIIAFRIKNIRKRLKKRRK